MGSTREVQDRPAKKKTGGSAKSNEIIEFFGEIPVNMGIFPIRSPSTWESSSSKKWHIINKM